MRGHVWAGLGATVAVAVGCARPPAPVAQKGQPVEPPASPAAHPVSSPPAQASAPPERVGVPAEATLGVVDRGVLSDLDAQLSLPPPRAGAALSAVVDPRHGLLVVYADGWPHKVYPLGGDRELVAGSERIALRPGDHAELVGRLPEGSVRRLRPREVAPPGDHDDDGIPDPLDILLGAKKTVLSRASYDDSYFTLKYPGGDPPRNRGACVDVVVRAVRNAGLDLQKAVIEDERAAGSVYGVTRPDPSIDHRRVRNAIVYFGRHWDQRSSALSDAEDPLRPGDVVFLDTFPNRPGPDHVGILAQAIGKSGHPLVINLWTFGYETQAMDLLEFVPVTHRFRFPSRSS